MRARRRLMHRRRVSRVSDSRWDKKPAQKKKREREENGKREKESRGKGEQGGNHKRRGCRPAKWIINRAMCVPSRLASEQTNERTESRDEILIAKSDRRDCLTRASFATSRDKIPGRRARRRRGLDGAELSKAPINDQVSSRSGNRHCAGVALDSGQCAALSATSSSSAFRERARAKGKSRSREAHLSKRAIGKSIGKG